VLILSYGRIVSALAKCGDGAMKRYEPSRLERLHNSFHNLVIITRPRRCRCRF
jgi:hypothetical protein